MTWLKMEDLRTHWDVAESLADFDYDSAQTEEIIEHFLNRLCARPMLPAYAYEKGKVTIRDVAEEKLKVQLSSKTKREINLWCERRARESAEKKLQYPKQAVVASEKDAKKLWNVLWETGKPKPRESAIAFMVCFVTGARMGEALSIRIEDRIVMKENHGEFWRFHLRSTKTDPFCKRSESINIPMDVPHVVPLARELRNLARGREKGLMFVKLNQLTRCASDYLARYSEKAGLDKKVTAHSGRVSFYVEGRQAGESQQTMAHTMRWAPNSAMPDYYERAHLECGEQGAPSVVARARAIKGGRIVHQEPFSPPLTRSRAADSKPEAGNGIFRRSKSLDK